MTETTENKKVIFFQIHGCNAEEENALKHVMDTIFPLTVTEGEDPIQAGFMPTILDGEIVE